MRVVGSLSCATFVSVLAAAASGLSLWAGDGGADVKIGGASVGLPLGITGLAALRQMSACGSDLLCEIPATRWDAAQAASALRHAPAEVAGRVRHGGFLQDAEQFEHGAFGISVAEAAAMDPQQRQLLERGYTALHAAGSSRSSLLGSTIAVSVGQWASEFSSVLAGTAAGRSVYAATGYSCSVTCGRLSFALGLHGACASYDTACSPLWSAATAVCAHFSGSSATRRSALVST